jgi:hypothetical protein
MYENVFAGAPSIDRRMDNFVDTSIRRIMFKGVVYAVGDNVIVTYDNDPQGTPWKAKIKGFIYYPTDDEVNSYFAADYYKHVQKWNRTLHQEEDIIYKTTGMNLVEINILFLFNKDSIKPEKLLQHKFMKIDVVCIQIVEYEMCRIVRRNTLSLDLF